MTIWSPKGQGTFLSISQRSELSQDNYEGYTSNLGGYATTDIVRVLYPNQDLLKLHTPSLHKTATKQRAGQGAYGTPELKDKGTDPL